MNRGAAALVPLTGNATQRMGPVIDAFKGDRIEGIDWMADDPPTRLSRNCNAGVLF